MLALRGDAQPAVFKYFASRLSAVNRCCTRPKSAGEGVLQGTAWSRLRCPCPAQRATEEQVVVQLLDQLCFERTEQKAGNNKTGCTGSSLIFGRQETGTLRSRIVGEVQPGSCLTYQRKDYCHCDGKPEKQT